MSQLPEKVAFHINDTHPAMVIPELMRILVDEERLPWEEAERITQATVAYTNHTIMAEALEKWPENMMRETLPRIYSIMQELNRRLCQKLFDAFPGQWDRIGHMAILASTAFPSSTAKSSSIRRLRITTPSCRRSSTRSPTALRRAAG